MQRWDRTALFLLLTALFLTPVILLATANGGPLAHTGAFGEAGCNECHRNEPLPPGGGRVAIDVGPYVPGQKQLIIVTVTDPNAARWGFQLAAREVRNPARQAGDFSLLPDDTLVRVRCASNSDPPCSANEMEYVTHSSLGTRAGQRSGFVRFSFNWTAPSIDVGDVIFTAAAVGADNDGGTGGDRSFTTTAISLFAPSNQAVFRDGGVVNAASFQAVNGAIGQGALVTLFGDKLAPPGFERGVARSDLANGKLPIELNRTGADFILPGGANPVPAYVLFVNERQMNVQVPALPVIFTGRIEVQPVFNRGQGTNEVRGNRVGVNLQPVAPGLFTFDGRSAAALHSALPAGTPVGRAGQFPNSRPARPGDVILVFGTGFGATTPPVEPGSLAEGPASLANGVVARIGGVIADVLYAGAAPTFAGLQQFNLRIPTGISSGDLPIVITAAGIDTQSGVILRVEP